MQENGHKERMLLLFWSRNRQVIFISENVIFSTVSKTPSWFVL